MDKKAAEETKSNEERGGKEKKRKREGAQRRAYGKEQLVRIFLYGFSSPGSPCNVQFQTMLSRCHNRTSERRTTKCVARQKCQTMQASRNYPPSS